MANWKLNEGLFRAAQAGDIEKVRNYLAEGANINYENWYGDTPLHAAAAGGFIDIVRLLLERADIDPNKENRLNGNTPLHSAAGFGNLDIVELLLKRADIDPNGQNKFEGNTPLHLAVSGGNLDIVKLFLQRADIDPSKENKDGSTPLHRAVEGRFINIVKFLLERADIDPNKADKDGNTPFDIAAEEERFNIVKLLLKRTIIDLNKVYKDGNTVLHKATRSGEHELVQLLLKTSNIDPNQKNKDGSTPFDIAAEEERFKIVKLLLERTTIDLNKVYKDGNTVLHRATRSGELELVQLLLKTSNIDPNQKNKFEGNTPLHLAVSGGNLDIVKLFLQRADIDPSKESEYGYTPLHTAVKGGFINIVQFLLERADIDPNKTDKYGSTPLHRAVEGRFINIVKFLLERADIDPNKTDKDGNTPFDIAAEEERFKIVKLLLKRTIINLNKVYKDGNTVLHKATRSGEHELVQLLLKTSNINPNQKNKDGSTPFDIAAEEERFKIVKLLLERTTIDLNKVYKDGNTVLHRATRSGELELVQLLLKTSNIDPNQKNKFVGDTPLHLAVSGGNLDTVKVFLQRADIDPSKENKFGSTPLHTAVKGGFINIVQFLLERADIDPNKIDKDGDTLLHSAVRGGHLNILQWLLERTEINPNSVNKDGDTLLHLAVRGGDLNILKWLLERTEINPNSINQDGDTLLHLAVRGGDLNILKWLLERTEINPNSINQDGDTLLHSAVSGGHLNILKWLLERTEINPNSVNKDGNTVLHKAVRREKLEMVKLLLKTPSIDPNQDNKTLLNDGVPIYKINSDTPLHTAVRSRNIIMVQLLLERRDINPDKVNEENKTPIDVFEARDRNLKEDYETGKTIQELIKCHILEKELRGLGLETTDDLKDVMKLGSFKCFWNRVYIVGPYFSGKSCLAKLLVGDALPRERESTDGIWIYMGRAGMDLNGEEWIVIPKGTAVQEILVSMMMSLSTCESLDTDNLTTRLLESDKNLHDSEVSRNSGHVEVLLLENSAQRKVHEERISKNVDELEHSPTEILPKESSTSHVLPEDDSPTEVQSKQRPSSDLKFAVTYSPGVDKAKYYASTEYIASTDVSVQGSIAVETDLEIHKSKNSAAGVMMSGVSSLEQILQVSETSNDYFDVTTKQESRTSDVFLEEDSPSVHSEQRRSAGLNFAEMCLSGVDKATYFASTEYIASTDVSVEGSIAVDTALETNKSTNSAAGIKMPGVSSLEQRLQVSQTANDYFDLKTNQKPSTAIYPRKDRSKSTNPVREKFKEKLMKEVANELSHNKLHEMVISSIREGKYKQKIIPIDIWDFGGQKDYYMTHQLFITSRGIFVLVFNGSLNLHKHMPDLSFLPGHFGKPTIAVYLLHWVNSILTYCKRSDDGFPRIVFVATHKDKIRKNVEKHKQKLMTAIEDIFESHAGLKHLEFNPLIFVNAMNENDTEIQSLRQRLMDRAKEHPRWGEYMPTAWVPLELHLAQQAEKGVNILTKEQIQMFNSQNESMVLTNKQLETFLKVQHSLGKLLYFDIANLRDFVIITPAYLVEVLRSIVTEKQFWPKGKQFQSIFQTMQTTGALSRDDIDFLWNQHIFKHILSYKDFIIEVLVHLDILVAERRVTEDLSTSLHEVSKFIVPSMITKPNNTKYLKKICKTGTSILLSYKFTEKVIPPAFPYRFIASFVDMWGVKNYKNKKRMLFSDLAVVEVDDKHDVAVQVIENRVVVSLIHADKKEHIVPTIATSVQECLTAAIHRISEFYSTLSADSFATDERSDLHMVMPFEIEFGVHCKKASCFFPHDKIPTAAKWQCSEHKVHHDVRCLKLWFSEKMPREKCYKSCQGLGRLEIEQSPSNKHLRRLAASLEVKDCRELLIRLGLDAKVLNDVQDKFAPSAFHENDFKYTTMLRWKGSATDSSFTTIQDALLETDKHLLCEVIRDVNVDDVMTKFSITEDQANKTPTNTTLQELSNHIGNSGIQLAVELGLQSAEIEGIQNDHSCKLLHQNKEILRVWSQTKFPKPTIKELIKALQRIGKKDCLREISF